MQPQVLKTVYEFNADTDQWEQYAPAAPASNRVMALR